MHSIVEKWSVVWSITSYAARKKKPKFRRCSAIIKSNTKPLPVKVYFTPLKQKTNLSAKAVK